MLEKLLENQTSLHLPNAIDFSLVYHLIEQEWDAILTSSMELTEEVSELCERTFLNLFQRHFKRF